MDEQHYNMDKIDSRTTELINNALNKESWARIINSQPLLKIRHNKEGEKLKFDENLGTMIVLIIIILLLTLEIIVLLSGFVS